MTAFTSSNFLSVRKLKLSIGNSLPSSIALPRLNVSFSPTALKFNSLASKDEGVHVEVDDGTPGQSLQRQELSRQPTMSSVQTYSTDHRVYQVLLAVITRFWGTDQFDTIIESRPELLSMPFLMWLADREAASVGEQKFNIAALCESLVLKREHLDRERMENLYQDTLSLLTDHIRIPEEIDAICPQPLLHHHETDNFSDQQQNPFKNNANDNTLASFNSIQSVQKESKVSDLIVQEQRERAKTLLSSSPELYAAALSEKLTGSPALVGGFDTMYDLILKAAPPAALTESGIEKAHAEAEELATDLRQRRKGSVASLFGRTKLTPDQADVLKAGSAACRILDMLLMLDHHQQRLECLSDCFTPPPEIEDNGVGQQIHPTGKYLAEGTDELWCTPSQLLIEVDGRIRSISGEPAKGGHDRVEMLPSKQHLTGPSLFEALRQLREDIKNSWLETMI